MCFLITLLKTLTNCSNLQVCIVLAKVYILPCVSVTHGHYCPLSSCLSIIIIGFATDLFVYFKMITGIQSGPRSEFSLSSSIAIIISFSVTLKERER